MVEKEDEGLVGIWIDGGCFLNYTTEDGHEGWGEPTHKVEGA